MKLSLLSLAIITLLPISSYAEISTKITTKQQTQNGSESQLKVLYQQDFTRQKSIPQGWRIPGNNAGNVYVENGVLNIDGRANAMQTTSILLPQNLEKQQNYRIDLEFSL
ncbi:MAG: glycerophosphodiester phosphodiesterase, partial [Acinetobacter sp.]